MYKVFFLIAIMTMFSNIQAQQNQVVFDTIAKKDILIGECNREGLMLPIFAEFYTLEYNSYKPALETLPILSDFGNDYNIVIVMGSWCGDSKEQVPRFLKIADSFGFPEADIRIICIDKNKTAPDFEEEIVRYGITLVPTFIFFRGENEMGRIVETPVESLEKDWLKIIEK